MKTIAACRLSFMGSEDGRRVIVYTPDDIIEMPDGWNVTERGHTSHPLALPNDASLPDALEALARTLRAIDDKKKGN